MSEFRRRLMAAVTGKKSILPEGYTQVQYLHLTSGATIDLALTMREQRDSIEIDIQFVSLAATKTIASAASGTAGRLRTSSSSPYELQARNAGAYYTLASFTFDTNRHTIGTNCTSKVVYADEYTTALPYNKNNYTSDNYLIGGSVDAYYYGVKYWRDGVIARDLIMCRDDQNNPYAYDIAKKVFRTLSGTITVGPDVVI